MKNLTKLTLFLTLFLSATIANATRYNLLPAESNIKWTGKKVTGKHFGTLKAQSGYLSTNKNGDFEKVNVVVDMKSITVDDIKNKKYNKKLKDHLKSADFFAVDKNSTSEFELTSLEKIKGDKYKAHGKLTIKKITKSIEFDVMLKKMKDKVVASGKLTIDRTKWDIKYKSGKFFEKLGDKMIYDNFDLDIKLTLK